MRELCDSSVGTRSEANVSAFSRREEEQPRGRRADRRKAAHGDETARIVTLLGTHLARRDLQERAQAPAVQVWLSGA